MTQPQRAVRVERLRLHRFRNYDDETVELASGLNVVSGSNAQGKTTLLEAIATLALTRSPRAAAAGELIQWGAAACRVEARVARPDGPTRLDMRVQRSDPLDESARAARTTLVDGRERPARALLGVCPVVLFWPEDLMLVKGGPEGRRRLCDVVLSQLEPRLAAELVRYRRTLEQRNALLRQLRLGAASMGALAGFTAELTRSGGVVQVGRSRLVAALTDLAADALGELSGGRERLRLRYAPEAVLEIAPTAEEAAERLAAALVERAPEELARGVTVAGPHRDDVEITLDGRPARSAASQGQQRSCVLACKLAEVRHVAARAEMAPVLLLDDVLSELDAGRRERLLELLGAGTSSQALLTTAEEGGDIGSGALGSMAAHHLRVEGGRVRVDAQARSGAAGGGTAA